MEASEPVSNEPLDNDPNAWREAAADEVIPPEAEALEAPDTELTAAPAEATDEQLDEIDATYDAEDSYRAQTMSEQAEKPEASAAVPPEIAASLLLVKQRPADTVTHVHCVNCNTKASWKGTLDAEMLERTFKHGVNADGIPLCPHCRTDMQEQTVVQAAAEQLASEGMTAAEKLDADKAGDAAKPMYRQSFIPALLPAFDFKTAHLTTESLNRNILTAKAAWDEAKDEAAKLKKEYDETVEALTKHIEKQYVLRMEWEYQERRKAATTTGPHEPTPEKRAHEGDRQPCITAQTFGSCSVCQKPGGPITEEMARDTLHLAANAANLSVQGDLPDDVLARTITGVTGIVVEDAAVAGWSKDDRIAVLNWLQMFALDRDEEPWARPIPLPMGRFHEAAEPTDEQQVCRVCAGVLWRLNTADGVNATPAWPVGQKVGLDCAGAQPVEPARLAKPRHADPKARQRAKQAAAKAEAQDPLAISPEPQADAPATAPKKARKRK
jgi:hypothetical protein